MRLFVDSARMADILPWFERGVARGVTTNPILLRREGFAPTGPEVAELIAAAHPHPICIQVGTADPAEIVADGRCLAELGPNVVVKVPVCAPDGTSFLDAIHALSDAGVRVNATLCFSAGQAAMAAAAGATYVSLLVGRISDEGGDPARVVREARTWIDGTGAATEIVAASIRAPGDLLSLLPGAPHVATVTPPVLEQLAHHHFSRVTAEEMLRG
jgi:transaldolase